WIAGLFDHVPSDLRKKARDYGVTLSDEVMQGIRSDMNSLHLSEQAATIFNAAKLFPTVDATNFSQALKVTRDAFSMLATKQLTAAQAGKVLQDMWPNLAKAGTSAIGVINKGLVEMIRLDQEAGTHTQAIADFLKDQATSGASSFSEALGVTSAAYQQLADDQQKLADLQSQSQTTEIAQQIKDLTKDILTQQGIIDATTIKSQGSADAMGAALAAEFDELLASGVSFADAIKAVGPGIDSL